MLLPVYNKNARYQALNDMTFPAGFAEKCAVFSKALHRNLYFSAGFWGAGKISFKGLKKPLICVILVK